MNSWMIIIVQLTSSTHSLYAILTNVKWFKYFKVFSINLSFYIKMIGSLLRILLFVKYGL